MILLGLLYLFSLANAQCDAGWRYFKGTHSCFQNFYHSGHFLKSDVFCHLKGARIASLTTKEETDFVKKLVGEDYPRHASEMPYLGLTAPSKDCKFTWLEGNALNRSAVNWSPGNPNSCRGAGTCVSLTVPNSNYGRDMILNDICCTTVLKRTLCKKPAEPKQVQVKMPCDEGWSHYKETDSCFKDFVRPAKYDESMSHCRSFGAELVTISTSGETLFLKSMIVKGTIKDWADFSFIGMTHTEGDYSFRWTDGSPQNYSVVAYDVNKPNFMAEQQFCVMFEPSWWQYGPKGHPSTWFKRGPINILDDVRCWKLVHRVMCKKGAVEPIGDHGSCKRGWSRVAGTRACRKDRNEPEKLYQRGDPECDNGWSYFKGTHSCFKNFHQSGNFLQSDAFCHAQKSRIASLETREEADFVKKLVGADYPSHSSELPFVGLTAVNGDCQFTWLDGSSLNRSAVNWAPGNPNKCKGGVPCVVLTPPNSNYAQNRFLDDVSCDCKQKRTLCKKPAKPDRTPAKKECDKGWSYYKETNSCFKNFARPAKFETSKSHCRSFGAEMGTVSTPGETMFVKNLVKDKVSTTTSTWYYMPFMNLLGLNGDCNFKWPDLTPMNKSVIGFITGKPNHCTNNQFCIMWELPKIWRGGAVNVLDDIHCWTTVYRVLCRKSLDVKEIEETVVCKDGWSHVEGTNTCVKDRKQPKTTPVRNIEQILKEKCDSIPERTYFDANTLTCVVQSSDCSDVKYPGFLNRNANCDPIRRTLERKGFFKRRSSDLCVFGQELRCGKGESIRDDHCFWLTENENSWSRASNDCQARSGTLFVPHNDRDMQNVLDYLSTIRPSSTKVWLGLVLTANWRGMDGADIDYLRWTFRASGNDHSDSSLLASLFLSQTVSEREGSFAAYMRAEEHNSSFRGLCSRAATGTHISAV